MVYLDNIDGYEEVYEEFDGLSGTTEFIYYDIGKYNTFIIWVTVLLQDSCRITWTC